MKHCLLTVLLSTGLVFSSYAQIKLGIKAGANFADFSNQLVLPGLEDISAMTTHWHAGLAAQKSLSDRFILSSELLYSIKGFQEATDFNVSNDIKTVLSLHYLSVPVLLNYKPLDKVSLGAGIELGYLMDAQVKMGDDKNDVNFIYDRDFEWSLNLGFRFNISPALFLDGRYQWGLSPVSELFFTDPNGEPLQEATLKNRVLQVSLGYFIIR
jgi:hypothetical protein